MFKTKHQHLSVILIALHNEAIKTRRHRTPSQTRQDELVRVNSLLKNQLIVIPQFYFIIIHDVTKWKHIIEQRKMVPLHSWRFNIMKKSPSPLQSFWLQINWMRFHCDCPVWSGYLQTIFDRTNLHLFHIGLNWFSLGLWFIDSYCACTKQFKLNIFETFSIGFCSIILIIFECDFIQINTTKYFTCN